MPIYEYKSIEGKLGCPYCRNGFECIRRLSDPPLNECPKCRTEVRKLISAAAVGASKSGFDDRAKSAGFHKLKKLGSGEYEKQY
jgi:putative FmdB family regulatory protein